VGFSDSSWPIVWQEARHLPVRNHCFDHLRADEAEDQRPEDLPCHGKRDAEACSSKSAIASSIGSESLVLAGSRFQLGLYAEETLVKRKWIFAIEADQLSPRVAIAPSTLSSATARSSSTCRRPTIATRAPRASIARASAKPMPLEPPVTTTRFPFKCIAQSFSRRSAVALQQG
jgi:hypothetical protein